MITKLQCICRSDLRPTMSQMLDYIELASEISVGQKFPKVLKPPQNTSCIIVKCPNKKENALKKDDISMLANPTGQCTIFLGYINTVKTFKNLKVGIPYYKTVPLRLQSCPEKGNTRFWGSFLIPTIFQ